MSDMTELDSELREFVDRVARNVLASADVSEPLEVTIEDTGERTYRVIFHRGDEIKRLRAENAALLHRADRAERILDKLRHPREAVLHATNAKFPFEASMIMAAVKAAEQEVDNDKHR